MARPSPRRAAPAAPASAATPAPPALAEAALLLGLLRDLLRLPGALLREARRPRGRGDLLRPLRPPLLRLYAFAAAARATAALLLLNILGFLCELGARAAGMGDSAFLRTFALRPSDLRAGRLLPLFTHLVSHAGWAHLLGNLLTLLVFGRAVEARLGPGRTLGAYFGAACVSTALSMAAQAALGQDVPTLGASGAVAGLVALGTLLSPFTLTFEALLPMPLCVVGWLAVAADLAGARRGGDGVDHFAHLGGYLSVLLCLLLMDRAQRRAARAGLLLNLATAAGAAALWLALRR